MSNQSFAIVTIATALLALAAGAAAKEAGLSNPVQSTPTTLYFHMFDAQNDFPVNTQEPDPKWDRDYHVGIATNSLCFDELSELPPPASQPSADKEWHTLYGYSSPSYVEYDYLENGKPRVHPERGLSFDVQLDQGTEPVLHWYLATQVGAPDSDLPADPDNAPIALPNVVVRAIMRESDKISVDEEAYREGEVILQGQSEPALLAGPASQGPVNWTTTPDGRNVYEIRVPLRIESPEIPRATGYNLQVETFIANEYCDSEGDYAMPSLVDVHTSEGHRPRLELAIMNPVRIEHLHPQVVGDELVIHSALNSPWGNYDVDEASLYNGNDTGGIAVRILDASGRDLSSEVRQVAFVQPTHIHDHHQEPVLATWLWPFRELHAGGGVYTIEMDVWNDQRTAQASGVATFELGKNGRPVSTTGCGAQDFTQDGVSADPRCESGPAVPAPSRGSPGAGLAAAVAALGMAGALRPRRGP